MSQRRFERAREIFEAALERPAEERAAFINERCGEDDELRRHVERLLRQDNRASLPLDMSPLDAPLRAALDAGPSGVTGLSIGAFRVIGLIGRGGMGEVYEVEQEHPRRRVALKLLRDGLRTAESVRRFELEARVLGRLQHPGIACIHEAGVRHIAGAEQPYFVMELVRGRPLDEHVAASPTDPRRTLELFAKVCDAVEHAHRMGVVHRDLKPSNILVDESGHPKILDFGVARLIDPGETAKSMHTAQGQLVGTLAYMSPEQVAGAAHEVTSRSDVYSLGVILFELLAGKLPLDVRGRSLPEVARMIREDDPSGLGTVNPVFRGDLETIVSKALEKDPTRRYASAGEIGADIRRFLRDEPVVARPATTSYQLRKFARRHRELVAGLVMTFVVLVAGLVGVTWFALRESRQRHRAEANAAQATWESYRNCIAAADRSLRLDDVPRAVQILDSAPQELRGWEWRYLKRLADMSTLAIRASNGPVRAAVVAGGAVWTGDDAGRVARWDLRDGHARSSVQGHAAGVSVIAVSPDGRRCVSCTPAGDLACWDAADASPIWRFEGTREIHEQAFFPDGARLAVASSGRVVFLDAATGQEAGSFPLPVGQGEKPAVDRSGSLLLCKLGPVVVCFDLATQRELWRREGLAGSFSSDGSRAWVFSGSARGIQVIEARTGDLASSLASEVPLRYGSFGPWVPTVRGPSTIVMLDPATGMPALSLPGHRDGLLWAWVAPQLDRVVSADSGGWVRVWEPERCAATFEITPSNDSILSGDVAPDARRAVTAGWGGVKLWDLASGAELWTRFPLRRQLEAVSVSPDGTLVAVSGYDRVIAVLDVDDGRTLATTSAFESVITQMRWNGNASFVALTAEGNWCEVSAESGAVVRRGPAEGTPIRSVAAAPQGQTWAAGCEDGTVRIGPLDTMRALGAGDGPTSGLAFNGSGRMLASGSQDGSVCLWDCQTRQMLWSVAAQGGGGACAFAFSPDGTRLVAGFADGRALIMEIATGDVLLELHAGSSKVDAAAFSPDGGSIVAVSAAPGKCTVFEVAATPEVLASRTAQSDARALVDEMTQRLHFSDEIAAALRRASEMDPQLNQAAAQLAAARGDNANQLNSEAWAIARFPGRSAAEYALAVAKARHACAVRQGEHAFQNTLGVSLLRAGDFAEAIETLEGCIEMARAPGQPAHPVDLLALAIAEAKSGDVVAARGRLVAARESLSSGRFAPDPEVDWLLSEAAREVEQTGISTTPTR